MRSAKRVEEPPAPVVVDASVGVNRVVDEYDSAAGAALVAGPRPLALFRVEAVIAFTAVERIS